MKESLDPPIQNPILLEIHKLLDRQDEWLDQIREASLTPTAPMDRDSLFTDFSRGIFFLKEYFGRCRNHLTPEDIAVISQRLEKQTLAIENRYIFLEKALARVIR